MTERIGRWTRTSLAFMSIACASLATPSEAGSLPLPAEIGGYFNVPVQSMTERRFATTVRQQYDFSCGSAALATLLTYQFGTPVTEEQTFEEMFERGDQTRIRAEGFSLLDMKNYLERRSLKADGFQVPLDRLVESTLPAIVLIKEAGYNHFVVLKGLQSGRVLFGDPSAGTRSLPRRAFEEIWVGGIVFVITNRDNEALFNQTADWQAAPLAPLASGIDRQGLQMLTIGRFSPGDF